jgi:hypothetical protein
MVAVVEIEQEGPNSRAERGSRSLSWRSFGPIPLPASAASPSEQFDPCDHRTDFGEFNMIVAMTAPLSLR